MLTFYNQLVYLASNPIDDFKRLETKNGDIINSSELMLECIQEDFEIEATFMTDFRRACEQAITSRDLV